MKLFATQLFFVLLCFQLHAQTETAYSVNSDKGYIDNIGAIDGVDYLIATALLDQTLFIEGVKNGNQVYKRAIGDKSAHVKIPLIHNNEIYVTEERVEAGKYVVRVKRYKPDLSLVDEKVIARHNSINSFEPKLSYFNVSPEGLIFFRYASTEKTAIGVKCVWGEEPIVQEINELKIAQHEIRFISMDEQLNFHAFFEKRSSSQFKPKGENAIVSFWDDKTSVFQYEGDEVSSQMMKRSGIFAANNQLYLVSLRYDSNNGGKIDAGNAVWKGYQVDVFSKESVGPLKSQVFEVENEFMTNTAFWTEKEVQKFQKNESPYSLRSSSIMSLRMTKDNRLVVISESLTSSISSTSFTGSGNGTSTSRELGDIIVAKLALDEGDIDWITKTKNRYFDYEFSDFQLNDAFGMFHAREMYDYNWHTSVAQTGNTIVYFYFDYKDYKKPLFEGDKKSAAKQDKAETRSVGKGYSCKYFLVDLETGASSSDFLYKTVPQMDLEFNGIPTFPTFNFVGDSATVYFKKLPFYVKGKGHVVKFSLNDLIEK